MHFSEKDQNISTLKVGGRYLVQVEAYESRKEKLGVYVLLGVAFVIIITSLFGCAHTGAFDATPVLRNSLGEGYRICRARGVLSYKLEGAFASTEALNSIRAAAEYWNSLVEVERPLFVESTTQNADLVIKVDGVRPAGVNYTALGSTSVSSGRCRASGEVWLSVLETGDASYFESIVRHELGHVLGLDHTVYSPDLMNGIMEPPGILHPLDVSRENVESLRRLYPEHKWSLYSHRWEL
jgi:hypothetical protein